MTTYFLVNLRGKLTGSRVKSLMDVQKSEISIVKPKMCFPPLFCSFIRMFIT